MRVISLTQLESLYNEARSSQRLRAHLNLHQSFDDKVQRLYIAMLKGSFVEPHFHKNTHQWEMFFVLEGVICLKTYHSEGNVKQCFWVGENHESQSIEISPNEIHSVECISDRALLLEIKEGPFNPEEAKIFPEF